MNIHAPAGTETVRNSSVGVRPIRIPLNDRFPKKYAVNSLPLLGSKKHTDNSRNSQPKVGGTSREPPKNRRKDTSKGKQRENYSRSDTNHAREEGDPSSVGELEYHTEPEDTNQVRMGTDEHNFPSSTKWD